MRGGLPLNIIEARGLYFMGISPDAADGPSGSSHTDPSCFCMEAITSAPPAPPAPHPTPVPSPAATTPLSPSRLTHLRLGHPGSHVVRKMAEILPACGLSSSVPSDAPPCEACCLGKATLHPKGRERDRSNEFPLSHFQADLLGKIRHSPGSYQWALGVTDLFSGYTWVRFLSDKSQNTVSIHLNAIFTEIRTIYPDKIISFKSL